MNKLIILLLILSSCSYGDSSHTRQVISSWSIDVFTVCVNNIEYITTRCSGTAVISTVLSVDKGGKPKQCNY